MFIIFNGILKYGIRRTFAPKGQAILLLSSFILATLLSALPGGMVYAAPVLTITPITWNVIGLDSNNVNVGPNNFPVGARVCNTGATQATNLVATFNWDTTSPYINLRSGSLNPITLSTLAAGSPGTPSCHDFYFEVAVTRNSLAYNQTARYHISVSSAESGTLNTPTPRELFVEHLISQNRNAVIDVKLNGSSVAAGGTMSLLVGNTYTIELDGSTATQGYNQLEDFINFPNTIFQVLSVASHYSADSSGFVGNTSDKLYADGCLWDNNPTSPTYRSCVGSDGKVGGTISTVYTVKIIGGVGTTQTLSTLIYDFSGSSYHYNSDFSTSARFASIVSPLSMSKSFSPVSITSGGTSTLSIAITNTSASAVTGVSLTDTFPTSPGATTVASPLTTNTCGGSLQNNLGGALAVGSLGISLTGGTVPASSTCTITVAVTAANVGAYTNTTEPLLINGSDTGTIASANLTVTAILPPPGGICSPVTLAIWTFPTGFNVNTPVPDPSSIVAASASTNTTNPSQATTGFPTAPAWGGEGFDKNVSITGDSSPYFQFLVNTSGYSAATISIAYKHDTNWGSGGAGTPVFYISSSTTGGAGSFSNIFTDSSTFTTSYQSALDKAATSTGSTSTYFRINAVNATNTNSNMEIDNVVIKATSCGAAIQPTITKAFSLATIAAGTTSTLTFTLNNTNTAPLTAAAFSDTLPSGVQVAAIPAASNTCGATFSPLAGATTLSFTGGTIPASGSCTAQVNVTAASAGVYNNTSGFISTTQSGTNTDPSTGSASATLTVLAAPVISKAFSPNPIYSGSASTLTFTITNPNAGTALSGLTVTDAFPTSPGAMTVAAPLTTTNTCGGSLQDNTGGALAAGDPGIRLTGGTLAGGSTCTVSVNVTPPTVGSYLNTSGAVSSTNAGTGNTASDTLGVQAVHPGISMLKQVATSPSGPWASTVNVAPGGNVYYRLTIENIGDVPLSPVSVTDPTLNIASCTWPSTLPVGTASVDPTASCVVGPITAALSGSHPNTATAHGTYLSTVYDSTSSTATYAITDLTLDKSVTGGSTFSAAGNTLTYSYTVTNTGAASLPGPVTVTDSNSTVTCPAVTTVGDLDSDLDQNESIVCTASYTVTAFDISVGSVTNTAYAMLASVKSNTDRVTIYRDLPDLVISKANSTGGYATNGVSFDWTMTVTNQGPQLATFADGQTIFTDQLPTSGATYGTATIEAASGITGTGTITCSINGGKLLTCTASGGSVIFGATTGSFAVKVPVTPTTAGSLVNASAVVDPNSHVAESNEGNNTGSNAVTVSSLPVATIAVSPGSVLEDGTTNLVYTLTLDQAPLVDTTINIGTSGTAASGTDYTGSVTSVTIPAGQTTGAVTINPKTDTAVEGDETVILTITSGTGYTVGMPSSATGTITDDDLPVATIAVSPVSVLEDGTTDLVYTVTLDQAPLVDTTINLTTTGTTSGTDYTGSVTSVTIPAGQTTGTVTINPTTDTAVEGDETVILTIGTGTGYTVGIPSSATGTITDDDLPVATIAVSPGSVLEDGTTNLVYTVTLDQAPLVDTIINLTTTGTTSGTDYTGSVTSVTIPAGQTTGSVTISPTTDTTVEGDETVILTITSGTGYAVGNPASATGTITDNDLPIATIAVSPALVLEDGSTNLVYTVTLDQAPLVDTTINIGTSGTAASGTDYTGSMTSVTISAGSQTATVTIDPTTDTTVEGDETVILTIGIGTGYTVGIPSSATGTISDNDLPVATITISPASVLEDGSTDLTYTVTLDQAPLVDTTINLSPSGTAASGADYTGAVASVTIPAGSKTATVTISPTVDTTVEGDETVILTITNGTGYTIGAPSTATGTIIDDDIPIATIAISPTSVLEDGTTNLVYTVTLDQAPLVDTIINLTTTGTASGTDYTGSVTSVTIPAGQTTGSVTISPTTDTTVEGDETVILTITSGTGYTIGAPSTATGTIIDDDLPIATIAVSPASILEDGATNLVYTVTLDQAPLVDTTVNLTTTGTATSGTDYTGSVVSITILAGQTTGTATISPTTDTTVEGDETVILTITSGTGYAVGIPSSATGTITDDDLPVATIAVSPASVLEDGATNLVYTVTLDQAPLVDTTINLTTTGTAANGTDYTGPVVSVTILAGQTTGTVTIDPTIDTAVEGDETVILTITSGLGYTVGIPSSATGTITDDDKALLGIAKHVGAPVKVSAGVYDVTYTLLVHNYSSVALSNIQVTDDLNATFPSPSMFTVQSVSSAKFTVNWSSPSQPTDYNGNSNTNLLAGADSLAGGDEGAITVVVRVTPAATGPFVNTAVVTATDPLNNTVTDDSTDGANPDPDNDGDPTNNQVSTPITFGATIFDPPLGIKTFDAAGLPVLQWRMVWINESAINPLTAQVNDPIPVGTTFAPGVVSSGYAIPGGAPAGSTNLGISCQPAAGAVGTTTTLCYYEGPTATYLRGRLIWAGTLGPDLGHLDEASAVNELIITYNVTVGNGVSNVQNIATIDADLNGNAVFSDPGEATAASASSAWFATASSPGSGNSKKAVKKLPATGFAPGVVTDIPAQALTFAYSSYSDLKIEIPSLKVNVDIVGVPFVNDQWDITWLGANAGYLNGTAFPTWLGNSVITGHVYMSNGLPGPFVSLSKLKWGDRIIVHAFGQRYIYEVRSALTVRPENTTVLGHKDRAWVTLLTCKEFDAASRAYKMRTAVQAVLISVVDETSEAQMGR